MAEGLIYYILDLETTGLKPNYNEIIELSIIRYSDRVQLTRQVKAEFPKRASYDALQICNKTLEDLYIGIPKLQAVADVEDFFGRDKRNSSARCIVGHNISFDRRFLHALWESHNKNFAAGHYLDTKDLSKRFLKSKGIEKPALKLGDCLDHFGLKKFANSHTAKSDTRATYTLFKHLMDQKIDYLDLIKSHPHRVIKEDLNDMLENESFEEDED